MIGSHTPAPGLSTHRIEAFSDGLFAIVMTLLVFELKVPDMVMGAADIALLDALVKLWPKLLSFVLSFVIVGIYWVAHHHIFHHIIRTDRTLLWLNNLFLMFVAFIPFPAALMGTYIGVPIAVVPYGLTLIATGLSLQLLWWYATRKAGLANPELDARFVRMVDRRTLAAPAFYLVAILASIADVRVTLAIYAVVPLFYIMPSPLDRHMGTATRAPSGEGASKSDHPEHSGRA